MEVSKKVVIAGHFGVGKSSLIKRFVHEKFSEQYLTTIGVKIDKKVVDVKGTKMNLILWDIAGEQSASKIPKNYFMGAHGLLYVFDLSREETYRNIADDLFEITKDNPNIQSIVLGNKSDLVDKSLIEELRKEISVSFKITSAMSGENVETAFITLAEEML
ncbi:MAG: Rab family GTPase [Cyclobacteriaceae bacterium]